MIEFSFNGTIEVIDKYKDTFVKDFQDFLSSRQSQFRGTLRVFEFDDCEIVEDEEVKSCNPNV